MQAPRKMHKLLPGLIAVIALAGAAAHADDEAASDRDLKALKETLKGTVKELTKTRDKLADKLGARVKSDAKAGENYDMFLRFDEGADEDETHFVMRRRGKEWLTSYAVVPRWRQESFYEYFSYVTRGRLKAVMYDKWRAPADVNALNFDGKALTGGITATFKLDQTKEERFPDGTPTRWARTGQTYTYMERCNALNHHKRRVQSYNVKAKKLKGVYEFDLWLDKAIDKSATLQTRIQVPAQPWIRGTAWALNWNCGYHGVDAVGLTVENGVLSGPLMVALNPDRWFPKKPHYMVYNLNVKLDGRRCTGDFKGEGDFGECSGTVRGEGGEFVSGTYDSSGDMGIYHAMVYGRIMPARAKLDSILSPDADIKGNDADAARALVARVSALYNDIRGLCLATKQYPFPIEDALIQTKTVGPEWGPDGPLTSEQVSAIAAFASDTKQVVDLAVSSLNKKDGAVVGMPDCGDITFGPFSRSKPLAAASTNAFALPAGITEKGPQKWAYVPYWSTVGPFRRVDNMDHNAATLPDIVSADGAEYEGVFMGRWPKGKKRPPRFLHPWKPLVSRRGRISPPWSTFQTRRGSEGTQWYARTTLVSDKAQEVWVSIAVEAHGKLWVNGKLAWIAAEAKWRNQRGRDAIFKVALRKGENDLLVRCREDRHETWLRMYVCVQGAPDPESRPQLAKAKTDADIAGSMGDGSGRFGRASTPPLAWDIKAGKNVAWSKSLPGKASSGVAAADGKLFVCCAPNLVVCLDQKNGKVLWQKALAGGERSRGQVLTDGKMVWACMGGQTAGYNLKGVEKWRVPATGERSNLAMADGKLLVESGSGRGAEGHTCAAMNASTGKVLWKTDIPGGYNSFGLHILRLGNGDKRVTGVMPESLQILDLSDGSVICDPPDTDAGPGSRIYQADDMFVYAKRSRVVVCRYFVDPHGQVGVRRIWRNHYGIKYDSHKMALIAGRYVMIIGTVQEDCKGHSNAAIRELYAYDRETGRPIKRLKPLLLNAESDGSQSTYVAPYVFCHDGGGGASGGHPTSGQIGVARIDGEPQIISRNMIPLGAQTPVFDGDRMFISHGPKLWCIAVTDDGGRKYQDEKLAETLFEQLWDIPKAEKFGMPKQLPKAPEYGTVAISRLEDKVSLPHWMVAGPFPLPGKDEGPDVQGMLAALQPKPGDALELGGTKRKFAALPQEAVTVGYRSGGEYYLCGLGTGTATVFRNLDVLSCTGGKKNMCGVLYTVVENTRPRVALIEMPAKGVEAWMGGIKMKPFKALQLEPGPYPLVVRVRPDQMGKKPKPISIAFQDRDDPRAARDYWLGRVNLREAAVKNVAKVLAGNELGGKADTYLQELGEYKALIDLKDTIRSARNGGSGMFANSRPPVPWERGANLKWESDLPGEPAATPVASGDRVFVSVKPNMVVACNRADGKVAWKSEVPKASGLSAPAVTKDAVYVADASGTIARFRLNGTTVWTEALKGASGRPATLVSGNTLIIQAGKLYGVDTATGKAIWTAKVKAAGAPASAVIEGKAAVLTCDGTILDASNGKAFVKGLPATGSVTPQMVKNVVYSAAGKSVLANHVSPGKAPEKLWEGKAGAEAIATPVIYDGMVYVLNARGDVQALNAADGKAAGKHSLAAKPKKGVSDLLLGGMHLFAANLGDGSQTIVLKPGDKLEKVWEYTVPGATVMPCFLANSEFIAGDAKIFCVDGKPPVKPGEYTPLPGVKAAAALGNGVPVVKFEDNQMPMEWLFSGPIKPQTLEEDFLKSIGGREKPKVEAGKKIKYKDQEFAFAPLDVAKSIWGHPKFTAGFDSVCVRFAARVGVTKEKERNDNSTVYLYTVIDNDKPRFVELNVLSPGGVQWNKKEQIQTRIWLNGVAAKDRDVVAIAEGKIPIMIQVSVGTCSSSGGKIWMAPRLVDRTDKYAGEKKNFEAASKVWEAYAAAKDKPFVLK